MRTKLVIIGAGQYGQNTKDIVDSLGIYKEVVFADDNSPLAECSIEEGITKYNGLSDYIVAIGNPRIREEIVNKLDELERPIATIIHKSAYIAKTAKIGMGSIIEPGAIVNANTTIGKSSYICAGAIINHNATIGDYVQVNIGAIVPANKEIGKYTKTNEGEIYV